MLKLMHSKLILLALSCLFVLVACGKSHVSYSPFPGVSVGVPIGIPHSGKPAPLPSGNGGYVKTGKPYKVAGRWYYPLKTANGYDQTGVASWYGKQFHGHKTANGERYDMYTMSAAHKTLPLPSMVRVTNLDNGRSVIVRVNDRGPFVKSRIIDLSYAAAKALGYDTKGTAHVRVQAVNNQAIGKPTSAPTPTPSYTTRRPVPAPVNTTPVSQHANSGIYVQLGAFSSQYNANQLIQTLSSTYPNVHIQHVPSNPSLYRVRIGPYQDAATSQDVLFSLQKQGYHNAIVVVE